MGHLNLLIDGFSTFARCSMVFNKQAIGAIPADDRYESAFRDACLNTLIRGSFDEINCIRIMSWPREEWVWQEDLLFAYHGNTEARIIACMKVAGDLCRLESSLVERLPCDMSDEQRRGVIEEAALRSMNDDQCPEDLNAWIMKNPELVHEIAGSKDQWEAAKSAERGTEAKNRGDHDSAISHYARAVKLETDPRRKSNYLFFYGCCLWQSSSRRCNDAIKALTESFALWPENEPKQDHPFVEIAIIHQNLGRHDLALHHLDSDPVGFGDMSGHFNFVKGRSLHALSRWSEALEYFKKAIELKTGSLADAYALGADCAFELNLIKPSRPQIEEARRLAKKALHLGRPWLHEKWPVG